jgi:hypothetical protein
MAHIPSSLRYSLLFIFALCGLVTASAIIRVTLMTAGKFLEEGNLNAYFPSRINLIKDCHGGLRLKEQYLFSFHHYQLSVVV